jgi:pimeloyl-ACP methyl ester carboxylesterase
MTTLAAWHVADAGGIPMSALMAEAPRPRAVIVALHGGAATPAYFDAPERPRLSLLRTGATLGFTVVALDRPGYGSSAPYADLMASAERRVDLAYAAVGALLEERPRGAGVFVLGHSMGCVLAVRMAADERGAGLLGLEIAGIGRHYQPRAAEALDSRRVHGPGDGTEMRDVIWGPDHLYPADAASGIYSPAPGYEGDEVRSWPRDFPALAAGVRIPVRYSLGDHEGVWRSGPAALADVAALFTAFPRVVAEEQASSGHNLSLGLSAMAYHLKILSFVEECALTHERSGFAGLGG